MSLIRRLLGPTIGITTVVLVSLTGCVREDDAAFDPTNAYIDARATLLQAADSKDPVTRSHAIEALGQTLGQRSGGAFTEALKDGYPAVRFAAAMAIGDVKYAPAKPALLRMASDKKLEPDKRVMCAVIYALYRLSDDSYAGELGLLLFDSEKEVRANAALIMGKMGEPSAIGPLKTLLSDELDASIRLQVTEALAMLGDTRSLHVLEAYTKTQFIDDRLVAIPAMARVRSPRAARVFPELLSKRHPPRVRVAAAGALAQLGEVDEDGYKLCVAAAENPEEVLKSFFGRSRKIMPVEVNSVRRLAAMSLGDMKRESAVDVLGRLLASSDGGVRVAAAMSILRILSGSRDVEPVAKPQVNPQAKTKKGKHPPEVRPRLHSAGAKD